MKTEKQIRARITKLQLVNSKYNLVNITYNSLAQMLLWALEDPNYKEPIVYYCIKCNIIHAKIKCPICKDKVVIGSTI